MGCSSSSGASHGWERKGVLRDGTEVWEMLVKLQHAPLEGDSPSRVRITKCGDEELVVLTEVENSFLQRKLLSLGHRRRSGDYDVQVGDIILEVNGRISKKHILDELSASHLHMRLQRRVAKQPLRRQPEEPDRGKQIVSMEVQGTLADGSFRSKSCPENSTASSLRSSSSSLSL
eukprot:CAMPEP_0178418746 /NCGR_PEP_ID=MMETSP0689_2-20121128/25249_1 /TAXON_ID=160604 /ORGANISM="Amphidinium massartii, Strain CS-259" /LENGTH=174 /DNA_ID=CAMNT_0020040153 /DNA_START=33 /DNA_END=557 /DNA_ORIENTATION=+